MSRSATSSPGRAPSTSTTSAPTGTSTSSGGTRPAGTSKISPRSPARRSRTSAQAYGDTRSIPHPAYPIRLSMSCIGASIRTSTSCGGTRPVGTTTTCTGYPVRRWPPATRPDSLIPAREPNTSSSSATQTTSSRSSGGPEPSPGPGLHSLPSRGWATLSRLISRRWPHDRAA